MSRCCCLLAVSLLLVPACSHATVIHVDVHGGGGYTMIQSGIVAAAEGDTVLVASGTYHESSGLTLDTKNLVIMSVEGPDSTIIDQQLAHSGFEITGGQNSTTVIEGFTIARGVRAYGGAIFVEGTSPTIRNCIFSENQATGVGGAIAATSGGHPTVAHCTFESNTAFNQGGAINVYSGGLTMSSCSFFDNTCVQGGAAYLDACVATVDSCTFGSGNVATGAGGGGIRCSAGSLSLTNSYFEGCEAVVGGGLAATFTDPCTVDSCDFVSNVTSQQGGALYAQGTPIALAGCGLVDNTAATFGGALYLYESPATITSCMFLENTASVIAGAVHAMGSTPTFTECTFIGNSAADDGAVRVQAYATPVFEDCLFHGNSASNSVGALSIVDSNGLIDGCTFTMNQSPGVAGVYFGDAQTTLTRSIIAFSPQGIAMQAIAGNPVTTHCCVFANAAGDSLEGSHHNNMFVDPLFCGLASGDLSLCANSFCLPVNNIWFELIGAFPQGCAECVSPVQAVTWGHIKSLYR